MKNRLNALLIMCMAMSCLAGCGGASSNSQDYVVDEVDLSQDSVASADDVVSSNMTSASISGFGSSRKVGSSNTSYSNSNSYDNSDYYETEEVAETDIANDVDQGAENAEITFDEEKLVYRCDIDIETRVYDDTYAQITSLLSNNDGIIQSEKQTNNDNRWYYYESNEARTDKGNMKTVLNCRVPSKNYNQFVNGLSNLGDDTKIMSKSTSVENISQEYYDNEIEIETLKTQEQRLQDMLDKASTIEEMIEVEKRLTEVQNSLNKLTTDKKYMDMDVAYSYVDITLKEVKKLSDGPVDTTTFIDRLKNSFVDMIKDTKKTAESLVFWLVSMIPFFIVVGILAIVFRKKIKASIDKRKAFNKELETLEKELVEHTKKEE